MSRVTISRKGQLKLAKDVLDHLGVQAGEFVTVLKRSDGAIELQARQKGQISDVFNSLKRKGAPRLSIKQMKKIAEEGWAGKR